MNFKTFSNINILPESFNEDIKPLIREIKPSWNVNSLKTMEMKGGVSNILFGVYSDEVFKAGETDMVLVRVYGNLLLDRDAEMTNMSVLSKYDLSAKVFGKFANGCCYEFIHGSPLDWNDILKPEIYTLIIEEVVKLHAVDITRDRTKEPFLFTKLRETASHLPSCLADGEGNERYLREFPRKQRVLEEIDELEKELVRLDCPVTFCHNDLLVGNIILGAERTRVHMIDFEYADFNYCAFDIANHFNEFAGLENTDYSRYPGEEFQKVWLRQYLETLQTARGDTSPVDTEEVDRWYRMTNKFALGSHLLWSIWSIWQAVNSCTKFDYLGFGILRWKEYVSRKAEFLALQ